MSKNSSINRDDRSKTKRDEINIGEIIEHIIRKKYTLLISIIISLAIMSLYNNLTKPVYQSSVTFKKENIFESRSKDEFGEMFSLKTMDEIDTETEILKTRTVLGKAVEELHLAFIIEKIEFSDNKSHKLDLNLLEYNNYINQEGDKYELMPQFLNVSFPSSEIAKYYMIEINEDHHTRVYDAHNRKLIESYPYISLVEIKVASLQLLFNWSNGDAGCKIYFKIQNVNNAIKRLQDYCAVERMGKTNLYKFSMKSNYPKVSQLVTNKVAEKYQEARLEQKKQSIQNSHSFIDEQLNDISQKLKNAEEELSNYKSSHQIAIMDESSKDIISSLSELESEKIKTDLQLTEYQNKLKEMEREIQDKGYFDQTYLTPITGSDSRSPFSGLLEQLSDAEIKRLELLQKRKETHPDVVTLDEQIAKIKMKLAEYNENTITSYKIIINSLQKKESNLRKLINEYSTKVEKLPEQETRLAELMREKNVYEKMFKLLFDKREELRIAEFSKLQDVIVVDSAQLPNDPISPRKALNLLLGMICGVVFGLVAILAQDILSRKIKTVGEIELEYPFPILAILPKYSRNIKKRIHNAKITEDFLVTLMGDQLVYTEPYRVLRTKLKSNLLNGKNTFIFTSCEENTGKTTIVANFAVSLARTGKMVLIVDCDLRKPKISTFYKIPKSFPGLIQFLSNDLDTPNYYKPFKENLNIIPAGGNVERSSELLGSDKMQQLLLNQHNNYDYILLDTPPVTKIIDTLVLGEYIKDVILVVRPNHTYKDSLLLAAEELEQVNMKILGFIINACTKNQMPAKYKYGYRYGYEYHDKESVK